MQIRVHPWLVSDFRLFLEAVSLFIPMKFLPALAALLFSTGIASAQSDPREWWPAPAREAKPWTYWWWMASAVDPGNITRELERYRDAGLGGVHIIPIYGAKGFEDRFIEYLSPKWMEMLRHTVTEARRLGLDRLMRREKRRRRTRGGRCRAARG